MNCHAKFDAASFILGEEIRNRTNTQYYKKKQTVTGISNPYFAYWHVWITKVNTG